MVTPTLGLSRFLGESLDSVERAQSPVQHVIIGPSGEWRSRVPQRPWRMIIDDNGGGMYSAINQGILCANSDWDYLMCLNDDDSFGEGLSYYYEPGRLSRDEVCYGRTLMVDANGTRLYMAPHFPFPVLLRLLLRQGIVPFMQCSMVVPRRIIEAVGLFDVSYKLCGDLELISRMLSRGVKFRACSKVIAQFRIHGGQLSGGESKMRAEQARANHQILLGPERWFSQQFAKHAFRIYNTFSYIERFRSMRVMRSSEAFYGK